MRKRTPGKVVPVENQRQGNTDQGAEQHTQHGDVQAVPQGLQIGQALRTEKGPVILQGKPPSTRQALRQGAITGVKHIGEKNRQHRNRRRPVKPSSDPQAISAGGQAIRFTSGRRGHQADLFRRQTETHRLPCGSAVNPPAKVDEERPEVMPPSSSAVQCREDPINWTRVTVPLIALGADSSVKRIPSGRMEARAVSLRDRPGGKRRFPGRLSTVRTQAPQETVTVSGVTLPPCRKQIGFPEKAATKESAG